MCGRYTLTTTSHTFTEELDLAEVPQEFEPRYNIAPSAGCRRGREPSRPTASRCFAGD